MIKFSAYIKLRSKTNLNYDRIKMEKNAKESQLKSWTISNYYTHMSMPMVMSVYLYLYHLYVYKNIYLIHIYLIYLIYIYI